MQNAMGVIWGQRSKSQGLKWVYGLPGVKMGGIITVPRPAISAIWRSQALKSNS